MKFAGVILDEKVNKETRGIEQEISSKDSKVKVYVIPTDEEIMIARDTKNIIEKL